jgi:hypothetical protein
MGSRTPNNATAKLTTPTRRRLCLAESTDHGKPQVCIRDLDHPGGHTPAPRDQIPEPVLDRLKDGDTSDLPLEGPGADEFDGVHYPPPDPPPSADELVAAEQEQAAEAHALAVPDQPRPVAPSARISRNDAAEELVRAGLSTIARPSQQEHALKHSLELARVTKLVETAGQMFADLATGELVAHGDIRRIYALSRSMAITSGIDLSEGGQP